jgi:hypothetical protein
MGKKPKNSPDYDERGYFAPGNKIAKLGGRPKGTMNFSRICRQKAEEMGVSLEDMLWMVATKLFSRVEKTGDPVAAKLLIDKICGEVPDITVDNRQINVASDVGPPVPSHKEMAKYIKELAESAARLAGVEKEVDIPEESGKDSKDN